MIGSLVQAAIHVQSSNSLVSKNLGVAASCLPFEIGVRAHPAVSLMHAMSLDQSVYLSVHPSIFDQNQLATDGFLKAPFLVTPLRP